MTPTPAAANPYAHAADTYWQAGWRGLLPLPHRHKKHPPTGTTGYGGQDLSYPDVHAIAESGEPRNIGLRLPPTVIGIDVDHYDGKDGGDTLAHLEAAHGPLPATWRSTSRDDGISGIRLYTIPPGRDWPSILGPGIDVIRHEHRYAVVAPSLHPDGGQYVWIHPDGTRTDTPPPLDRIPALPAEWTAALSNADTRPPRSVAGSVDGYRLTSGARTLILAQLPGGDPCPHITAAAGKALAGGSRHDTYNSAILAVLNAGRRGCPGAITTLQRLHSAFLAEVAPDRAPGDAANEWARSLDGALALIVGKPQGTVCQDLALEEWLNQQPDTTTDSDDTADDNSSASSDTPAAPPAPVIVDDDYYAREVQRKAFELQVVEDARQLNNTRKANALEPLTGMWGDEFIHIDYPEQQWVVDQLWPAGGRVMLSAAAKSGKSTLILNLLRAMLDGHLFLNSWTAANPDGCIMLLNMEIGERQFQQWLRRIHISDSGLAQLHVANLRGKSRLLGLGSDAGRDRFVNWLGSNNTATVILDPLAPVLASLGIDENDNTGVSQFFDFWNHCLVQAGVRNDFIAHHTGRATNARSRGASRFDDEPDAIWTLINGSREDEASVDASAERVIRAYGRDVELPDTVLEYDPTNGLLRTSSKTPHQARRDRKETEVRNRLITWVSDAGETGRQFGMFSQSHGKGGPPGATDNDGTHTTIRDELIAEGTFTTYKIGGSKWVWMTGKTPDFTANTPDTPSYP